MVYATPGDVRAVLAPGGSQDDPATAASLGDDDLTGAITAASNEVDARLAGRYQVPFDPPPPLIHDLVTDLAAYRATLIFRKGRDFESNLDPVYLRGQDAAKLLDQLASGQIELEPQAAETNTSTVVNRYAGSLFDLESAHLSYTPRGPRMPRFQPGGWW